MIKFDYSVVIPTHDRMIFLNRAIDSIFSQYIKPREIFVVDDLQQNETYNLVRQLSKRYKFYINYITSKSNNGVSRSYNLGASIAKGEYLAFLDDDDFWGENYIKFVSQINLNKKFDMIITRLTEYDDKKKIKKAGKCLPKNFSINDFYLRNLGVLRSNLVIKKSCFDLVNGYDESIYGSSDKDLFMRLKILNKSHFIIDYPNLVYWRTNHSSQASTNYKRMLRNVIFFYKKYFFSMHIFTHLKMLKKILRLMHNFMFKNILKGYL